MRTRSIVVSIASLSLLGSCSYRAFDDLEDLAWVRADSEPSKSPSAGFGIGLVASGGEGMEYFVASKSPPVLFRTTIEQSGSRVLHDAANPVSPQGDGISADPFPTPAVLASDLSGFDNADGNIAVSIIANGTPMLYMVRGDGQSAGKIDLAGAVAPTGIAFGDTDATPEIDLFAAAGERLNVIGDYADRILTANSCGLGGTAGDVLVAEVGAADGAEVLVAVDGEILVTTGSALQSASDPDTGSDCFEVTAAAGTITAPGDEASFGALIRQGDFDGNGSADIVVAAPGENAVYVFLNWTVDAPTTGTRITTPSGAASFGTAVATGDFNADGRDELVISDPGISANSKSSAGSVFIYEPNGSGEFADPVILHDADPKADQVFGQSLAIAEAFGGARLIVGAKDEVFTYFRTPIDGDVDFTEEP